MVTEYVEPLRLFLDQLSREQIIAGLHDLLIALKFLNSNDFSHNSLSIDAIFVSRKDNFCWKIGSLEFLTKLGHETDEQLKRLMQYKEKYQETNTLPPEDLIENHMKRITERNELCRRDVYSFGLISCEMLANEEVPQVFINCKAETISQRPSYQQLVTDAIFTNCDYLKIKQSIINFASISEGEKGVFLENLVETLREIDPSLLASAILPLIITSRIFMLHPLGEECELLSRSN